MDEISETLREFVWKALYIIGAFAFIAVGLYLFAYPMAYRELTPIYHTALTVLHIAFTALILYTAKTRSLHGYWRLTAYVSAIGGLAPLPFYFASTGVLNPSLSFPIFISAILIPLITALFLIWLYMKAQSLGVAMPYNGYTLIWLILSAFGFYPAYTFTLLTSLLAQPKTPKAQLKAAQPPLEWMAVRDEE